MSGTVTAIEPQKRNKDRVSIFIDGQFGFGISSELAQSITIGRSLSADDIESFQTQDMISQAREAADQFLSYRPRSIHEVRHNLEKKQYNESVIAAVIENLLRLKILDDRAFADYWIEQRETFRPRGRFALKQELHQKGVSPEISNEALGTVNEFDSALRAGKKKAIQLAGTEEMEFRRKLGQYLKRRGFEFETIAEVTSVLRNSVVAE